MTISIANPGEATCSRGGFNDHEDAASERGAAIIAILLLAEFAVAADEIRVMTSEPLLQRMSGFANSTCERPYGAESPAAGRLSAVGQCGAEGNALDIASSVDWRTNRSTFAAMPLR